MNLKLKDTIPAVMIGEAMSSTIPLGILISGTAKAVAVRKRMPLVAGLSSVATENLFYSFTTGLFLITGALLLLVNFATDESLIATLYGLVGVLAFLIVLGVVMVVRQWHFASAIVNWLYKKGFLKKWLEHIRFEVRRFEDLIYGFYRHHPRRFLPICSMQVVYHLLGVAEVWIILNRLMDGYPSLLNAFLLESVSRLIAIMFKLVPLMIGVDEAGAQFVGQTIVARGRASGSLWRSFEREGYCSGRMIGMLLIVKRGLIKRDHAAITRNRRDRIGVNKHIMKQTRVALLFLLLVLPLFVHAQTIDEKVAEIDAYANTVMDTWHGPGMAIAIVKDDKVVFAERLWRARARQDRTRSMKIRSLRSRRIQRPLRRRASRSLSTKRRSTGTTRSRSICPISRCTTRG